MKTVIDALVATQSVLAAEILLTSLPVFIAIGGPAFYKEALDSLEPVLQSETM